jgi:hypothetical protein
MPEKYLRNARETHEKRMRSTTASRWWLVWVGGGRKWVLGSSKATNVACSAVFDPGTNDALSWQLGIRIFCVEGGFCFEVVDVYCSTTVLMQYWSI